MAGAGKKTFTAGETLTASDVNTYLMEQSVMYFAGTAARSSAIPTPSTGMTTYIGVTGTATIPQIETYTGSAWQTPYGLTQVANVSFTSVSSVTLDNVFTSSYLNYRMIFEFAGSTNANRTITMAFRAAGSTVSATNYQTCTDGAYYGGGTGKVGYFYSDNNKTYLNLVDNSYYAVNKCIFNGDIISPQPVSQTIVSGSFLGSAAGNSIGGAFNGIYSANTAFDGLVLTSSSGNITGTLKIYGYRNS